MINYFGTFKIGKNICFTKITYFNYIFYHIKHSAVNSTYDLCVYDHCNIKYLVILKITLY